jgi:Flp pilus assembly pilin Flp
MKGAIPMLFLPSQDGQGLTEYALILLFVALAVVLILTLFGEGLGNTYEYISDRLPF